MAGGTCPVECEKDRENINTHIDKLFDMSLPKWARTAIFAALGLLFVLFFQSVLYVFTHFQTKETADKDSARIETTLTEIKKDVKTILRKEN